MRILRNGSWFDRVFRPWAGVPPFLGETPESRVSVCMRALHQGWRGGGSCDTLSLLLVSVPVPPLLYVYSPALLSSTFSL